LCQVGWGGGRLNKRTGKFLGDMPPLMPYPGEWRNHWNFAVSFDAISGDSGSGVFATDRKELVAVLWGGISGTTVCIGPEYCQQAYELCRKRRGKAPIQSPPQQGGGGGLPKPQFPQAPGEVTPPPPNPTMPAPAEKPKEPVPPACQCKPPEKVDLKPVTDALGKLAEAAASTSKSVSAVSEKVNDLDKRLSVIESKPAPAPVITPEELEKLRQTQAELEKLKEQLKQSGRVRISVVPAPK
jgi:hypothetical protein